MKRRNTVLVAALALIVALAAYGTVAMFSGEAHVTNVITTGSVDIDLIETNKDGEPWTSEDGKNVMPGTSVVKKVEVKNIGESPAWVRVQVETTITDPNKKPLDAGVVSFDFDETKWIDGKDGYYYYSDPLAPNTTTLAPLFTNVIFDKDMNNDYQGCDVAVDVSVGAVQVKNNGETVQEATGWPAPAN